MALDMTSFASALKQHYVRDVMEMLVYKNNPFYAMVPKYEKFGGKNLPLPVIYGTPQGRSTTFSTAVANKTDLKVIEFLLVRRKDYAVASIDNETLEASQGDANAFMEAATAQIDGAIRSVTNSIASSLMRDGSGTIARVNATSGTTWAIATASDVINFEIGQKLQFSSAGTSATLRNGGSTLTVSGVDRSTGNITTTANLNTVTGITLNDFINVQGDIEAKIIGLGGWLPQGTVSATAFFGVDRSVDRTRLAGVYYDGSAQPIEEALIDGLSLIEREGGSPDYCFMNFANLSNLKKALGSKVQYVNVKGPAGLSFQGVMIDGNKSPVAVVGDQNCPALTAFFVQMDTWKLYSLGMAPRLLEQDGLKMLRESSSDSVEVRVGAYAVLGSKAPGWSGNVKLAS